MLDTSHNRRARKAGATFLLFVFGLSLALGTTFGQPALSKIRITLRRSYIDVRG